jgi:hypothetical protein
LRQFGFVIQDNVLWEAHFGEGKRADGSVGRYRNIRMFSRSEDNWMLELWYNYELTSL